MTARALIGGQMRHLGAWKPSPLKLRGIKPTFDVAELRLEHTIAAVPTDYDQGQLSSCGPNALAEAYETMLGGKWSRLFSYFFTRATEGDFLDDDGVTIADLVGVAHTMGMPPETLWPYDLGQFAIPPPLVALVEAVKRRVTESNVIVDLDHLLYELDREQPVLLGFGVPKSMEDGAGGGTATTGLVNVPSSTDPSIGGHAVLAMGFSRTDGYIRTTCHYGGDFGDHGTIKLPFAHFTGCNASDFTAIREIG